VFVGGFAYWLLIVLGVGGSIGMLLGPATGPTWYPRTLRRWGHSRGVRVEFVLDRGLRLREGPEVEVALGRLVVRQYSAILVAGSCFGLSTLALLNGPRLSESTANSIVVAGLPLVATLVAVHLLRNFVAPYRTAGGRSRPTAAEDFVWPVTRALIWCTAAAAVLVPVAAAILAAGPSYDAGKVWWEGLIGQPLAGAVLVIALEGWLTQCTDVADETDPTLYVWDCLRARAVKVLLGVALINLVLGFQSARGGLNGVALVGAEPTWLDHATAICWLLQVLATAAVFLLLLQPTGRRLRERLWPTLPPTQPIEFGTALPIP
jgi:hypothetical protein